MTTPLRLTLLFLAFNGLIVFIPAVAHGTDLPCGEIIGPDGTEEVLDCEQPFGATTTTAVMLFGTTTAVSNHETVTVPAGGTREFGYKLNASNRTFLDSAELYKHEGDNYGYYSTLVPMREQSATITAGVYTLWIEESSLCVSQAPRWQRWVLHFFPVAHAFCQGGNTAMVTFTVIEAPPEPTGASSVLFLPGIQASRLYQRFDSGQVVQVWEPGSNDNVRSLRMNSEGESVNDIFTEDVIEEVFGVSNIYKDFIGFLDELQAEGEIDNFDAFAYDWRFSVQDIVVSGTLYENEIKSVVEAIEQLAENSNSNQVTIVAHSNGGLLAKSAMIELERLGEAELVEQIIFIGTPHLGTPKALGTILHGYDQQQLGGALIDDVVAREIINNLPGVYALLPSERYVVESQHPVVLFREGTATEQFRNAFSDDIVGVNEYRNFLKGTDGRENVQGDISRPYTVNDDMLDAALTLHRTKLDDWEPPAGVEVYNLVGVGLPTMDAIEYRTVTETRCQLGLFVCEEVALLRPFAQFTQFGDETVVGASAAAAPGKTYYFDLDSSNRRFSKLFSRNDHANLLEAQEINDFINDVLTSTSSQIDFISQTIPELERDYDIVAIDSPVDVRVTNDSGEVTGIQMTDGKLVGTREIPGSDYVIFGGTKYVLVPRDEDISVELSGRASGRYTLTIATLNENDEQVLYSVLSDATTTPTMIARFSRKGSEFSVLETDQDGDGEFELVTTLEGEVLETVVPVSYATLKTLIEEFELPTFRSRLLLRAVERIERIEERWEEKRFAKKRLQIAWYGFTKLVRVYEQRGLLTSEQKEELLSVVDALQ